MSALTVARTHYRHRRALAAALAREAARLWRQIDVAGIAGSWELLLPRLLVALTAAQKAAAGAADAYVDAALAAQAVNANREGRLAVAALAGVASDGRDLADLLRQPIVTSRVALARGAPPTRALASGQAALDMIVRTQVADAGRVADQVALVARRQATGYVRMVVGRTCDRCLVLAGRRYRWSQGFRRHPRCDCVHIPAREDTAADLRTDPDAAFRAMTRAEQDKVFGKAGAEAIRSGADMAQVVNARRGMYTAGGRLLTREGTTRRGLAGQRLTAAGRPPVRLMPEQILAEARGDRGEAIRLLRLHGYLI